MPLRDRTLAELADLARVVVRSGYLDRSRALAEMGDFVRAEVGQAEAYALTQRLVEEARAELARDAATWPERTDNDALEEVFGELRERGLRVLEYCQDQHDANAELQAHPEASGIVFCTETDVWHAITDNMLELKVWHADTSNVVSADPELAVVIDVLTRHGLPALFDEGRIEVSMTWRRRSAAAWAAHDH